VECDRHAVSAKPCIALGDSVRAVARQGANDNVANAGCAQAVKYHRVGAGLDYAAPVVESPMRMMPFM
jgi:hypothetical protein